MWVFWIIPHKYIYDSVDDMIQNYKIDEGKLPIDNGESYLTKHFVKIT